MSCMSTLNPRNGMKEEKACVEGILEMCPSLLLQVNAEGDAPLHVAAKCGNLAVLNVLIEFAKNQPKDVESVVETVRQMLGMTNKRKNTGLHEAVQSGRSDIVKTLIEADPNIPYSTNDGGESPLYMAAKSGSPWMVAIILDYCPSAAHEGPNGKNVWHAAVTNSTILSYDRLHMIDFLREKKNSLSRERDQYGWTPLHYSAYLSSHEVVISMLLECDDESNDESTARIVDEERKMTALHLAAGQGHISVVTEIISYHPECYNLVDVKGWNVLHFAMVSMNIYDLKELLEECPRLKDLNDKDENGNTPLHVLAALRRYSSYEVVPRNRKGNYRAVNNENISVENVIQYGYTPLKQQIRELSKYKGGRGQYTNGVVRIEASKRQKSFLKYIDEEVIGAKEAKGNHLVVAALIATVTFAAAFTVPGGFHEDGPNESTAILRRKTAFQAFVISNAMAMVLSLFSVFVHFILSLKAFGEMVFLFVVALFFTIFAMLAMIVAFVTGTYAVLSPSLGLAIAACFVGLSFFLLMLITLYMVRSKAGE